MRVDNNMYELAVSVMRQIEANCPKHGKHLTPKCDCGSFQKSEYRLASLIWGAAMFGKEEQPSEDRHHHAGG